MPEPPPEIKSCAKVNNYKDMKAKIGQLMLGCSPTSELMHMIRNGQLKGSGKSRPAQQFYSLAT